MIYGIVVFGVIDGQCKKDKKNHHWQRHFLYTCILSGVTSLLQGDAESGKVKWWEDKAGSGHSLYGFKKSLGGKDGIAWWQLGNK